MELNKLKQLSIALEKIKQQKSDLLVEKGILENQQQEIKIELNKFELDISNLDSTIKSLGEEMAKDLVEINIPQEFLDGR